MEIVKAIREHVELATDFSGADQLRALLSTIEGYVEALQANMEVKVRRCINLEGLSLILFMYL